VTTAGDGEGDAGNATAELVFTHFSRFIWSVHRGNGGARPLSKRKHPIMENWISQDTGMMIVAIDKARDLRSKKGLFGGG